MPGPTRYSGSVSGPQLAVPRPRCAASRWTIVSALGVSSTSWVAAARSAARRCVAETCRGSSRTSPQATTRRRRRASSQRTSAWPPFSCGRMYGHVLVGHGRAPAADEPAALAIRIGLVRTRAEPFERLRARAPSRARCRPAARSVSASGIDDGLGHADPAVGQGGEPLLRAASRSRRRSGSRRARSSCRPRA